MARTTLWYAVCVAATICAGIHRTDAQVTVAGAGCTSDTITIGCSGLSISSVPIDLPTTTESLDMSDNSVTTFSGALWVPLSALMELNFANNLITTVTVGMLTDITTLQRLDLSGNALEDVSRAALAIPSLIYLNLRDASLLTDTIFSRALFPLVNLEELILGSNSLTAIPEQFFEQLSALRVLSLDVNSLTILNADDFVSLTLLETLDLSGNSIAIISPDAFTNLLSIVTLSMSGNPSVCSAVSVGSIQCTCDGALQGGNGGFCDATTTSTTVITSSTTQTETDVTFVTEVTEVTVPTTVTAVDRDGGVGGSGAATDSASSEEIFRETTDDCADGKTGKKSKGCTSSTSKSASSNSTTGKTGKKGKKGKSGKSGGKKGGKMGKSSGMMAAMNTQPTKGVSIAAVGLMVVGVIAAAVRRHRTALTQSHLLRRGAAECAPTAETPQWKAYPMSEPIEGDFEYQTMHDERTPLVGKIP